MITDEIRAYIMRYTDKASASERLEMLDKLDEIEALLEVSDNDIDLLENERDIALYEVEELKIENSRLQEALGVYHND